VTAKITTGIDAIEIYRIEAALERWGDRFIRRIYTDGEVAACRGKAQSLAGRFAAKEATSKALGVGIRVLRWRDIEILRGPAGKPTITLHGRAALIADRQGLHRFEVSITHTRSDAFATVIAWEDEDQ
jgi:holo-[acyl-carrier protein] synthase